MEKQTTKSAEASNSPASQPGKKRDPSNKYWSVQLPGHLRAVVSAENEAEAIATYFQREGIIKTEAKVEALPVTVDGEPIKNFS
jgi:hypothetical protein